MDSPETEGVNSLKPLRRQGMCPLLASVGSTLPGSCHSREGPQTKEELVISSRAAVKLAPTVWLSLRRSWEGFCLRQR